MKGWKEPGEAVKSYRDLERLRGVPADRLLTLPAALAPEADEAARTAHSAERMKIYDRLGRPAKAEDYKLEFKDGGEFAKAASTWFHELGLNVEQAQAIGKKFNAHNEAQAAAQVAAYESKVVEQQDAVKREWGGAYEKNMSVASGVVKTFGFDKPVVDALESALGWGGTMKLLHNIGKQIGEDRFVQGGSAHASAMTPEEAKTRIGTLKADKEWVKRYTAGGSAEAAELERLQKFALA
jgi:hypothetical protein